VHIGPVTLRQRFNAVATGGSGGPAESDELQAEPFTAAWTLASIAALSLDGVASACYFEPSGPRGIADAQGRLYPAGELLRQLAALKGAPVLAVPAAAGPVTVYPVSAGGTLQLFAGNLSPRPVATGILLPAGTDAAGARAAALGGPPGNTAAGEGRRLRLALQPWSTVLVRIPSGTG
jgi:hypothetical protein